MASTDFVTEAQIDALAAAIATRVNTRKTEQGTLASLTTTVKTSIVAAINELVTTVGGISSGAAIADGSTGTGTTWSSSKINTAISDAINALTTGAPAALNTLDELAAALGDDASFAATMTTALGNRLRVDAAQGLTSPQQAQGRSNLGIGTSTSDFAATFNTATA